MATRMSITINNRFGMKNYGGAGPSFTITSDVENGETLQDAFDRLYPPARFFWLKMLADSVSLHMQSDIKSLGAIVADNLDSMASDESLEELIETPVHSISLED